MEFVTGTFLTVPDYIRAQLSVLVLGPTSGMSNYIHMVQRQEWPDSPILYAKEGPWVTAWATCSPVPRFWHNMREHPSRQEVQMYVRPEFRRKGLGRSLYREALRIWGVFSVCPWDETSNGFFKSVRGGEANG